jgi:hypothetical protein
MVETDLMHLYFVPGLILFNSIDPLVDTPGGYSIYLYQLKIYCSQRLPGTPGAWEGILEASRRNGIVLDCSGALTKPCRASWRMGKYSRSIQMIWA